MGQVFITGGVHGDEPSGALALDPLRDLGFEVFGPCNPWGLKNGRRTLESGRDLNRMFAGKNCSEARAVQDAVLSASPILLLDLHEHRVATKPYLIQFGPRDNVGAQLVNALRGRFQFEQRPRFGPLCGRGGVLRPPATVLWLVGVSRRWPLAYWFWRATGRTGLVAEAPGAFSVEQRVEFHLALARAARELTVPRV